MKYKICYGNFATFHKKISYGNNFFFKKIAGCNDACRWFTTDRTTALGTWPRSVSSLEEPSD